MYFLKCLSRVRAEPYLQKPVTAKFRKVKSTAVQKVQDRKKTGGGPPVVMSPAENLWYDLFHDTVYCTGIVDHENFQEVGLGGNIFT